MSGSTSLIDAIVDRMMERLKKENPHVDYHRKPKKEKVPRKKKEKTPPTKQNTLH